jgi:hypothetical protein
MSKPSEAVGKRMRKDLENAYMEIIPVSGIEERLGTLQRNMHVAVTCSPTKGVDETRAKWKTYGTRFSGYSAYCSEIRKWGKTS